MDAYIESWRISDLATADPSKDWSSQIQRYMTDPFKTEFIEGLEWLANSGNHTVGHVEVTGQLTKKSSATATILSCIDTSHQDTIDENGHSVVAGNGAGAYWRYTEVARMWKVDGHWKLAAAEDHRNKTC